MIHQRQDLRVLLVNSSAPAYNLGLAKAAAWWTARGASVTLDRHVPSLFARQYDVAWLSAIFSWHAPDLISSAMVALDAGCEVEVGGPGLFGLRDLIQRSLGLNPQVTPDARFERTVGEYKYVFWSRGCPAKNCSLGFPRDGRPPICSVPEMEGWHFTLYTDVKPARVILDNNLSALPRAHQELIVERTAAAGFGTVDCNSGFEPRSLRPSTIELWKQLPLIAWRFAYDEMAERKYVIRALAMLDAARVPRSRLRLYCLAGNEPIAECEQRVREIQDWGCLPVVQRRRPLDWPGGPLPVLYDWTERKLMDFQRWGNRLSATIPFAEYRPGWRDSKAAGEMFDP